MAWCENPNCMKDGLRKADIEFDETSRLVLCHGCMALAHPGWAPPAEYVDLTGVIPTVVRTDPQFGMVIHINERDGIQAAFSYGGASLALRIPSEDLQRVLGG